MVELRLGVRSYEAEWVRKVEDVEETACIQVIGECVRVPMCV